jgi:hypothetical protein
MLQIGMPYDNKYRILYRDASGQRWLSSSRKLQEQSLSENMLIILMIPNQPAPAAPAYVASAESACLPMTSSYMQNVQRPQESIDLSPYYVDLRGYQKVKKLGQGAFGAVYLVTELATGKQIALKELEPDMSDERQRISFLREVSILATMKHPALLSLHGCTPFQSGGDKGPCILTPYMSGGSIDECIKFEQ